MSKQFHVYEIAIDEKKDYERALWNTPAFTERLYGGQWRHHRVNSREARTIENPLFA